MHFFFPFDKADVVFASDIPRAICQTFYALGQLRPSSTPDTVQEFYSYLGILSLSFDAVLQPGCDGSNADFPSRFLNNVSHFYSICICGHVCIYRYVYL